MELSDKNICMEALACVSLIQLESLAILLRVSNECVNQDAYQWVRLRIEFAVLIVKFMN